MPRYQSSASKAKDNRSSAYTLLAVGGIGFIAVLMIFFNVIPLYRNAGINRYLVCGVMGAMFVLFIVFGLVSLRDSKVLLVKARSENSLRSEITRWCQENLKAEDVDALIRQETDSGELTEESGVGLTEEDRNETLTEEELYYRRTEIMRAAIEDKFMNLDEAFLDDFVDEYYQVLYEDNIADCR